jgi:serpin B
MKKNIRFISFALACVVGVCSFGAITSYRQVYGKSIVKIVRKKNMYAGQSQKLKIKGKKIKKVKWISSNKKVAVVSKKGNVIAKKEGQVIITAKVKIKGTILYKKYKCKINVNSRAEDNKYVTANLNRAAELVDSFESKSNILVSPISLNCVLGMAANSSDKQVKKEVGNYFGTGVDAYNEYINTLIETTKSDDTLNIANSVWYDEKYKLSDSYIKKVKKYYGAKVYTEPMNSSTIDKINNWADKNTDGMIKQVVDSSCLPLYFAAFNASLFDGKWTKEFEESDTEIEDFTLSDGSKIQVSMLNSKESVYYENEYATGFEKTYGKERDYSFIAILPKKEGEFNISDLNINSFMKSKSYDTVLIKLPKFEYEWSSDDLSVNEKTLDSVLDELNLSSVKKCKMLENCPFEKVGTLFQKTKIIVNEKGTKAAAVTGMMKTNSIALETFDPKTVYLDRPFAYMINDNKSGEILFIGKYVNPKK